MRVWIVTEENGFRCIVIGVYDNKEKATKKMEECLANRSVKEYEVE